MSNILPQENEMKEGFCEVEHSAQEKPARTPR
jgi:hypothetical protein